jgi:hypothetical protein
VNIWGHERGHSDAQDLENLLGEEAARRLEAFSAGVNKTTGSSHPADRDRWLAFLI